MSASDNLPAIFVREMRETDTIDVRRIHTECLTTSLIDLDPIAGPGMSCPNEAVENRLWVESGNSFFP